MPQSTYRSGASKCPPPLLPKVFAVGTTPTIGNCFLAGEEPLHVPLMLPFMASKLPVMLFLLQKLAVIDTFIFMFMSSLCYVCNYMI
jgi:hypothetical protein